MNIMKVKKNTLLLIACFVWTAAGFNILRIGIMAYSSYLSLLTLFYLRLYSEFFSTLYSADLSKSTQRE